MRDHDLRYPIRRWRLANFKSVEEADVEFAPLTVLVGPNSSGKSSLLQSILLVAQAAKEGTSLWLPLNGPWVELGDVQDVVFAGRMAEESGAPTKTAAKTFGIGAEFDVLASSKHGLHVPASARADDSRARISWESVFGSPRGAPNLGVADLRSARLALGIDREEEDWSFETKGERRKELEVFAAGRYSLSLGEVLKIRGELSERPRRWYRGSLQKRSEIAGKQFESTRTAGLVQVGGIPVQHFVELDRTTLEAREMLDRLERHSFRPPHLAPGGEQEPLDKTTRKKIETEVARAIILMMEAEKPNTLQRRPPIRSAPEVSQFFMELNPTRARRIVNLVVRRVGKGEKVLAPKERGPAVSYGLEGIGNSLAGFMARDVRYLGPLREDPRVVYLPTPGEREGNVGKKGEKAIALLHAHGKDRIECFFSDDRPPGHCTLAEGVKHWLNAFGIAEGIETELRPRLGLEPHLALQDVSRPLDMTAVGVGVSQIFPVLVMGLHSKPGSVLLMEQPELHLHPALQQRLGDFLLACARSGRQLIVETHSDHLISRLRRRVAEDESNQLQNSLAIIFAERNEGRTTYRPVEVNRYGGIEEWPRGFFDQAAKESQLILRAGLDKKKRESDEQS